MTAFIAMFYGMVGYGSEVARCDVSLIRLCVAVFH